MARASHGHARRYGSLVFQSLELLQNCLRLRAVVFAAADVLPAYDAVFVYDECGRNGDIASKQSIFVDDTFVRVVQDGERRPPFMGCRFRSFQVICADGENDCVTLLYRGVVVCQLDELNTAERSPERAVKDEYDVTVVPIRTQRVVFAARAWEREVGREVADIRSDGRLRRRHRSRGRRGCRNGSCGRRNGSRRWLSARFRS